MGGGKEHFQSCYSMILDEKSFSNLSSSNWLCQKFPCCLIEQCILWICVVLFYLCCLWPTVLVLLKKMHWNMPHELNFMTRFMSDWRSLIWYLNQTFGGFIINSLSIETSRHFSLSRNFLPTQRISSVARNTAETKSNFFFPTPLTTTTNYRPTRLASD